jgi:basic membrane protein A
VILPGWEAEEFLRSSGNRYPEVTFLGIDIAFSDPRNLPANVRSVLVREDDAGYLAGIVAGSLTSRYADVLPQLNPTPRVGAVLGMRIPPVDRFFDGFTRGVHESDPDVEVLYRVTDTFGDRAAGRRAADELIDEGVDIVFNIAGDTGIGVMKQAARRGALAIGVDIDQSEIAPQTVLTSATKDYHAMTYLAVERWLTDDLPDDQASFFLGIADGITPLAPFHEFEPYIPFTVRRQLDDAVTSIRETASM